MTMPVLHAMFFFMWFRLPRSQTATVSDFRCCVCCREWLL